MSTSNAVELGPAAISDCAREPIHAPGAIQPYGMLLVVDPVSLQIVEAASALASNGAEAADLLDQPLADVLDGALAPYLPTLVGLAPAEARLLGSVKLAGGAHYHAVAHRAASHIIVELEEPVPGEPGTFEDLYPTIRRFMAEIETATTIAELCALAAVHVRAMADFDRTLIYAFDKDWNGTVVAEDGNGVLPSYMDLRFPESDIPAQARELYRRNRVRLIADADYAPAPLLRSASHADSAPTDLGIAVLRSVSPVHLQYMRNMGTGASMSVSLLREGHLWGLISCHNAQPKRVPYHVRTACEFIGQILSLQIALKERAQAVEERVARRASLMRLLGRMAGDEDFLAALGRDPGSLLALTRASGAAIVHRGQYVLLGECPDQADVHRLTSWLTRQQADADLFETDHLASRWPDAGAMATVASGVLSISISQLHDSFLLWFRPEVVRTVQWGGDPRKDQAAMLTPRTSFEAWKQTVHQQSLPWDQVDLDAAMELRTAIVDIVLRKAEEMAELNEQLMRSNKELEAFSYSVSHDLRAPFRHIVGYSELLGSSAQERLTDTERRFLDTIVESAKSAGTLVDDLLSFSQMGRSTLGRVRVDMRALAEEVRGSLVMEAGERPITWNIPMLPILEADPAMLRLVWQNLFSNAIKFTRDTPAPVIEVEYTRDRDEHHFLVRDNGCGFDMRYVDKLFGVFQRLHHVDEYDGTGIGLANVRRIIDRHGGRTWAEGAIGEGATIHFTLPIPAGDSQ